MIAHRVVAGAASIVLLVVAFESAALREPEGAPQDAQALAEMLREHRCVVSGTVGRPSGACFDFLVAEGAASEFVLLGESHRTAETPLLFGALAVTLQSAGYDAVAVEMGPMTALDVVSRLREGGVTAHRESIARYPFTMPSFFEMRGEAELLETLVQHGYEVWGLDQEYIGSGGYWLDRLAALASDAAAREPVAAWRERERAGIEHYEETESTDGLVFQAASDADFADLRAAFNHSRRMSAEDRAEALAIVDALATSAAIYQLWPDHLYENNRRRAAYMHGNLVANLKEWEEKHAEPAKVLLKLGGVHVGRGRSPTNQFDVGNLAMQLATYRGGHSLHVLADALGMRSADGSWDDWGSDEPVWRVIRDLVDAEQPWTVFDLRPLRPYFHRTANARGDESIVRTVWNYDLVAVAPAFHPAEPLVE